MTFWPDDDDLWNEPPESWPSAFDDEDDEDGAEALTAEERNPSLCNHR